MARIPVVCLECGKRFTTASLTPVCPKCGGADVEPENG
jgi:Zn finger protein HypA/HybF involved in hydrogenase expression